MMAAPTSADSGSPTSSDKSVSGSAEVGDPKIFIFIKVESDAIIAIEFDSSATIGHVKDRIAEATGIARSDQCLTYDKRQLLDQCKLSDYNIQNGSTVELCVYEQPPILIGCSRRRK